ncbi:MAG: hypothetical protein MI864_10115 [Pseudomonadales bacterium]|uniref:Uncharacterized protein n=1 Tax=Oleiphilus messinensis TaxID=141451 RepID=A0A1Y0I1D8_9GAMM|nr:hypothetical protein [Oleiphilus messinensis]ARU54278.1 hypothetical protein OLMES_0170 [Oleiphilus messinensis]MCG8610876.1 hypothetical protein [Pseudomonadales bacterium]
MIKKVERWEKEKTAAKATQVAFSVSEDVQIAVREEALHHHLTPSDQIRRILGLPYSGKPVRPRLTVSLHEDDFALLAEQFDLPPSDHLAIKKKAAEAIIEYVKHKRTSTTGEDNTK